MRLNVITSNQGKAVEFKAAFKDLGISVSHISIPYDEIQADTLEEVVRAGVAALRAEGQSNFLIDDSGLFIDSLGGFPGVYSSYVQKTLGNAGVLKLLHGTRDRGAEFRCCVGCDVDGKTVMASGSCRGTILENASGSGGFGFDPIFTVDGVKSFAEIPMALKNSVSHRGAAIANLAGELRKMLR
ncbi:MAG: RdgB/HAM1 family non-canonical purine NTP pyrophosphatase [Thermoplasmatales archaeon]|nr:RdgB/HAM1 family non-canonical purine NTP pyrophosphatase [Thermoplasmatales archaeon]